VERVSLGSPEGAGLMRHLVHLSKRAWTSMSNAPLSGRDVEIAERVLTVDEFDMWWTMQPRDQAHSLLVLRRFVDMYPPATRVEQAAALLHDVGKNESRLGWFARVLATIVGPRGSRFRAYHDHVEIGARMLDGVSDPRTIALIRGSVDDSAARALQRADDI
jgi:hypothetical protein